MKTLQHILEFGKYSGKSYAEIYATDPEYVLWLACNSYRERKNAQAVYEYYYRIEHTETITANVARGPGVDDYSGWIYRLDNGQRIRRKSKDLEIGQKFTYKRYPAKGELLFENLYKSNPGKYPHWDSARLFHEARRHYTIEPLINQIY